MIQSVERALRLLETLSARGGSARLLELVADTGLGKSTAHAMLDTLVALGYVTRDAGRYTLGLKLRAVASPLDATRARVCDTFAPALRAFNELIGESSFLAVPAGISTYLTLDALDPVGRPLTLPPDAQRDALTTSAAGKTFLAHQPALARRLRLADRLGPALEAELQRIAQDGYALDLQASDAGLNCFALPLRLRGRVVATVSASGPPDRLNPVVMRHLARRSMRQLFDVLKA